MAADEAKEPKSDVAEIVEKRFLGGLTVEEVAFVMDVSASTVEREWRMARAWLRRELSDEPSS